MKALLILALLVGCGGDEQPKEHPNTAPPVTFVKDAK
jgi:hypothetical protein